MYQHPDQYGPPRDWVTTHPQAQPQAQQQQPLPSIQHMAGQHMAGPRMLPGMHGMNGANGYQPSPYMQQQQQYLPQQHMLQQQQQHYGGHYPVSHVPPPMPPQQMPQDYKAEPAVRPMELSHSGCNDQYRFTLVVSQQPQRARMCGFGDKDRRPITPPPCVRLLIHDMHGNEVDADSVNGSFFVLQVDLWNDKADREANIVRASNTASPSASISTATTTSFPPTPDRTAIGGMLYRTPQSLTDPYGYRTPSIPMAAPPPHQPPPHTMFTRNLIGSLTVNAAKLEDSSKKLGYWFVLQDLSVRTEGHFRLRMNFIDVGVVTSSASSSSTSANGANGSGSGQGLPSLNKGRAPVLAHVFSNPFQVYSAKKFPGVIESTDLSKAFAKQGVKIPIRKDTKEGKEEEGDSD
ncbi:hypothetical protein LTR75_004393 [Friedmanniomyces endolithicus]|nr:hypothetical protein LTR75_004393 [Friedmanniomyces endolithicus]